MMNAKIPVPLNANSHVQSSLRQKFTFLLWNVNGLLPKLAEPEFVNYVCSFDFVCLIETFLDCFQLNVFFGI